tara:strand:- start:4909 stop:6024 length:1116 start_codon:yes stop_codon:yes gene_type:complete
MYYFDHSATTPIHHDVLYLMNEIQRNVYGNPSSVHQLGRKARSTIETARKQVAKSIGAKPNQIIFTSGGTEANNHVLWSRLGQKNNHVVTDEIEHPAVLKVLQNLSSIGLEHDLVSVDDKGCVSINEIEMAISEKTGLVSVMLANNEVGTIQPIQKIVEIANKQEVLVHTDAVQCLGKMLINVVELDIDFLSLSAHKFYGPKGIGILFVKDCSVLSSFIIGANQENALRAGTENIASIAGMGLAAELATLELENHIQHLNELETQFKIGLTSFFKDAIFNGDPKNKLPGLISVSFPGFRSDILMTKLDRANMAVSSGSACGSGNIKPSAILSAMGIDEETNISTLRISFGTSNTCVEVDLLLAELELLLSN